MANQARHVQRIKRRAADCEHLGGHTVLCPILAENKASRRRPHSGARNLGCSKVGFMACAINVALENAKADLIKSCRLFGCKCFEQCQDVLRIIRNDISAKHIRCDIHQHKNRPAHKNLDVWIA